jgi:hypothetical protein
MVIDTCRNGRRGPKLAQINRDLKQLRAQLAALEERRAVLLAELAGKSDHQA